MASLVFRYGVMGSSKSANELMVWFNYTDKGQKCLLVKPSTDSVGGLTISSRIGLEQPCISLERLVTEFLVYRDNRICGEIFKTRWDCIIVDEVQFANKEQIDVLAEIVDTLNIPVLAYGLRTDFKGVSFSGSRRLLEIADKIEEVKMVCWCGRKATFNARADEDGKIIRAGEQVVLKDGSGAEGATRYLSVCRKHYNQGVLENPQGSVENVALARLEL